MKKTLLASMLLLASPFAVSGLVENGVLMEPQVRSDNEQYIDFVDITSPMTRGSASGISQFDIVGVISNDYPTFENISKYQTNTIQDHGGGLIRVAAFQVGYGNPNNGNYAGTSTSYSNVEYFCGSGPYHLCNVGESITAFMYYFNFYSNINAGTVSSNSTVFPVSYWSDTLHIK